MRRSKSSNIERIERDTQRVWNKSQQLISFNRYIQNDFIAYATNNMPHALRN